MPLIDARRLALGPRVPVPSKSFLVQNIRCVALQPACPSN